MAPYDYSLNEFGAPEPPAPDGQNQFDVSQDMVTVPQGPIDIGYHIGVEVDDLAVATLPAPVLNLPDPVTTGIPIVIGGTPPPAEAPGEFPWGWLLLGAALLYFVSDKK